MFNEIRKEIKFPEVMLTANIKTMCTGGMSDLPFISQFNPIEIYKFISDRNKIHWTDFL